MDAALGDGGFVVPWNGTTMDMAPGRWLYARASSVSE
jgi:hypothetical protein